MGLLYRSLHNIYYFTHDLTWCDNATETPHKDWFIWYAYKHYQQITTATSTFVRNYKAYTSYKYKWYRKMKYYSKHIPCRLARSNSSSSNIFSVVLNFFSFFLSDKKEKEFLHRFRKCQISVLTITEWLMFICIARQTS